MVKPEDGLTKVRSPSTYASPWGGVAFWSALVALLLLGSALRFLGLGEDSLWNDEITQASWAGESLGWIYKDRLPYIEAPLDIYITHFVRRVGDSEFLLRFPAAALGILSLALTYRLATRLFTPLAGLLAVLLLSTSPFHLAYSQELRCYSLFVFLCLLSLERFLTVLRKFSWGAWAVWVLATLLSFYAHFFTIFVFGAELLVLVGLSLWKRLRTGYPGKKLHYGLGIAVILLLWLPELVPALPNLVARATAGGGLQEAGRQTGTASVGILAPGRALSDIWSLAMELLGLFAGEARQMPFLLALLLLGVAAAWYSGRRLSLLLCTLLLLGPLAAAPFRETADVFAPRYFIFALPIFLALGAYGASVLVAGGSRLFGRTVGGRWGAVARSVLPLALVALILLASVAPVRAYYSKGKQDWRGVGHYLAASARQGDAVIQLWLTQPYSLGWYFHPPDGIQVLKADELRTTPLRLAEGATTWWVFTQQAQHKWLQEQAGDDFDISLFHGVSVLTWKGGPLDAGGALNATLDLLGLEAQIHTAQASLYYALIGDLLGKNAQQIARHHLDQGDSLIARGEWLKARAAYERATELWPEWGMAHTRLGNVYTHLGDNARALAAYEEAIRVQPSYVGAYIQLGWLHESQGQVALALDLYQQAVTVDPASAWAFAVLGNAYWRLGRLQDALVAYQTSLEQNAGNADAHMGLGRVCQSLGLSVDAVRHMERAVTLQPSNVTWMLEWAATLSGMGRKQEATAVYQRILALDPGNQQAGDALGGTSP